MPPCLFQGLLVPVQLGGFTPESAIVERQTCHKVPSIPLFCQSSFRDEGLAAINGRFPEYLGHSHKCTPQCLSGGGSSTTTGETGQESFEEELAAELTCS